MVREVWIDDDDNHRLRRFMANGHEEKERKSAVRVIFMSRRFSAIVPHGCDGSIQLTFYFIMFEVSASVFIRYCLDGA